MRILVYDTETTGFIDDQLPLSADRQPWPVQIAAGLFDIHGKAHGEINLLVNPPADVPYHVAQIHGITTERTHTFGFKPLTALSMFRGMLGMADIVVAHNEKFDREIILSGMARTEGLSTQSSPFEGRMVLCTQAMATPILKIPPTEQMIKWGRGGQYKSPTLTEAYEFFFGHPFENAHNGRADMMACAEIFFEILRREGLEKYGLWGEEDQDAPR